MKMTAEQVRERDLDNWSGTITIFSPVRIGKRLRFELEKDAARYVLTFSFGKASIMRHGRAVEIGMINQGVLELYQFGLRNEMLRHLLFPDTMQLNRQANPKDRVR
jgi:hypothetical protein